MIIDRRKILRGLATGTAWASVSRPTRLLAQLASSHPQFLFPETFYWGASTSALQVENSRDGGGGGRCVLDAVVAQHPKMVKDGSSPEATCDETHHWRGDIQLMRQIGLNAYRFSISWPRVLPLGMGQVNQSGLDFYDRFIDGLLGANIKPFLTLFHFDYPEGLQQQGGWLSPDSPKWFADYAQLLVNRFSDRVDEWLTINEPNIYWTYLATLGSKANSREEWTKGLHNLLLAHGMAVQVIRERSKRPARIALPFAGSIQTPATDSPAEIEAARFSIFVPRKTPVVPGDSPMLNNGLWLDPIFKGAYPDGAFDVFPALGDYAKPEDLRIIASPVDRCAVNLYFSKRVKAGPNGPEFVPHIPEIQKTHYGWEVTPDVLYWGPRFLYERYGKPILITENGISWPDKPDADGRVRDFQRVAFINSYLSALRKAVYEGVPIDGYMHWSLLDNWEFFAGFTEHFGLVYVDHKSQKRILKDSALYYREVIHSRGAALM